MRRVRLLRACIGSGRAAAAAVALVLCVPMHLGAQTAAPAPGATFTVERTADGQPDLQGVWRQDIKVEQKVRGERSVYPFVGWKPIIVAPTGNRIPYQPWARSEVDRLASASGDPQALRDVDPQALCVMNGPPRTTYQQVMQVFQAPGYVVFAFQAAHQYRVVPLDGRPHVAESIRHFAGDSRGRWDGDTLVVDAKNFNGRNWLDLAGDFRTEAFTIVERWTRTGRDELLYEATMTDPNIYTEPWSIRIPMRRFPAARAAAAMFELACHEGNRAWKLLKPASPGDGRIGR